MFADPQTVTFSAVPYTFPRVGSSLNSGMFDSNDAAYDATLNISHSVAKRTRHVARLDRRMLAADQLQPATNRPYSMSSYLVIDVPLWGFTDSQIKANVLALTGWLTDANLTKLIGHES